MSTYFLGSKFIMHPITLRTRISRMPLDGHTVLSIVLALLSLLIGFGFLFSDHISTSANYKYLVYVFEYNTWAALFVAYSSIKLASCLYRIHDVLKALNSSAGLWAWIYIYLSFSIFDHTRMTPLENILILPILCEVWALILIYYNPRQRRATDVCLQ